MDMSRGGSPAKSTYDDRRTIPARNAKDRRDDRRADANEATSLRQTTFPAFDIAFRAMRQQRLALL
jgi:hypothetical protein